MKNMDTLLSALGGKDPVAFDQCYSSLAIPRLISNNVVLNQSLLNKKYLSFKPYKGVMEDPDISVLDTGYYFKFYN
jgi:hypothetical protein